MAKSSEKVNIKISRILRKNQTPHEIKLWSLLRGRRFENFKFVRQYAIGKYIVDFCCRKGKLIIELDGGQHNEDKNIKNDQLRDKSLINRGYRILRVWNNELDENLEGVLDKVYELLKRK